MSESLTHHPVRSLTLDLLTWVSAQPRTYAETMDAWRSTCPRLTVWEDALIGGLLRIERDTDGARVMLTARGQSVLDGAAGSGTHR